MTDATTARPYRHRADEGEALWFLGSLATVKAGGAETHGRLAVIEFVNPAGFAPPLHRHLEEDEAFYVLSGSARFRCDEQVFDVGPGDFVCSRWVARTRSSSPGTHRCGRCRSRHRPASRTSRRRSVNRPGSAFSPRRVRSTPRSSATPRPATGSRSSGHPRPRSPLDPGVDSRS